MRIIYANSRTEDVLLGRRLRVRAVTENSLAERAAEKASETGRPSIRCSHGGDVCNSYGYPADTEGCVAVALDAETVVLFACRLTANKVTLSGAAASALPLDTQGWVMFDRRVTNAARKKAARFAVINAARKAAGLPLIHAEDADDDDDLQRLAGLSRHAIVLNIHAGEQ